MTRKSGCFTQDEAELQELMVHVHFDAKYRLEQAADLLAQPGDGALEQPTDLELEAELNAEKQPGAAVRQMQPICIPCWCGVADKIEWEN